MITLITGEPGAGKTAYVVSQLLDEYQRGREIFQMGIRQLKIPHEPVPPVATWVERRPVPEDPTLTEAKFTFPVGALVVIDEAQKIFRQRPAGSKVPDIVQAFETHRHDGHDFWLITQQHDKLDSHVRGLVGRHIHLRPQWSGRTLYEWSGYSDPRSRTERQLATTRPYRLPKRIFDLYESAAIHVHTKRRLPVALYFLGGSVLLACFLGYQLVTRFQAKLEPETAINVTNDNSAPASSPAPALGTATAPPAGTPQLTGIKPEEYIPRIPARPETAPLYDDLRKPKSMPVVSACIEFKGDCRCYTQQGTDAGLTPDLCDAWIRNPPFNPWREGAAVATSERSEEGGAGASERPLPVGRPMPGQVPVEAQELPAREG
jgi:zona occludens toxin